MWVTYVTWGQSWKPHKFCKRHALSALRHILIVEGTLITCRHWLLIFRQGIPSSIIAVIFSSEEVVAVQDSVIQLFPETKKTKQNKTVFMALKCQEISIKVYKGFTLEEFCKLSKIQRNWLSFSLRKQPFLLAQPSGDERRARRNGCFRKLTFLFVGLWKNLKILLSHILRFAEKWEDSRQWNLIRFTKFSIKILILSENFDNTILAPSFQEL